MNIEQMTPRQIQIRLVQTAIQNGAVAIAAFEDGLKILKEKQNRRFAELARQTTFEQIRGVKG